MDKNVWINSQKHGDQIVNKQQIFVNLNNHEVSLLG